MMGSKLLDINLMVVTNVMDVINVIAVISLMVVIKPIVMNQNITVCVGFKLKLLFNLIFGIILTY
jgi:hypothetical protein